MIVVQPGDRRQGGERADDPPAAQDPPAVYAAKAQGGRGEEPAAQDGDYPLRRRVQGVGVTTAALV